MLEGKTLITRQVDVFNDKMLLNWRRVLRSRPVVPTSWSTRPAVAPNCYLLVTYCLETRPAVAPSLYLLVTYCLVDASCGRAQFLLTSYLLFGRRVLRSRPVYAY